MTAGLDRFVRALQDDSPADLALGQAALTGLLAGVALRARPVRWFDAMDAACVHLTATTLARIAAGLPREGDADDPDQALFDAAEAAFDSGWANGWPEVDADCQIAAQRLGLLDRVQAAHRLWREAVSASPRIPVLERAFADAEAAMAEAAGEPDERRAIARDRVGRHRTDMTELIGQALMWLATGDAPACLRARAFGERAMQAWEAGVRWFWVLPDEIVAVTR